MINGETISLIMPCYNEEQGLSEILKNDLAFIDEILVVDNNSTDRTAEVARQRQCKLVLETIKGYGAAYKAGFKKFTGQIAVTMDGDNTYPIAAIRQLVETLQSEKLDFISANRLGSGRPANMTALNYLGNLVLTFVTRLLFFKKIKDSQSGMWIFRREILDKIKLVSDGMALSQEIKIEAIKQGFKFKEVDIQYLERLGEVKLNKWRDGFNNLAFLFYKRFY